MTFKQAMIVPTMVTLGCGTLLMAQNLSLVEVSYAAPAPHSAPVGGASANASASASDTAVLPMPADGADAEFGDTGPKVIKAISDAELGTKALQSSGREDPFMSLVPPDPSAIVPPPVSFPPIKPIPLVSLNSKPAAAPTPKIVDLPWSGDQAPSVGEPQWLVRGIMSTGSDRVTLLEGRDATIQAHIGDVLDDGSKVVAISSRGVTFIRGGRRFVKLIGGSN